MQTRARMSISADGYVTTSSGCPTITADPAFVSGESHCIQAFLKDCAATVMNLAESGSLRSEFEATRRNS